MIVKEPALAAELAECADYEQFVLRQVGPPMWEVMAHNEREYGKGFKPSNDVHYGMFVFPCSLGNYHASIKEQLWFGVLGRNIFWEQVFKVNEFPSSNKRHNFIRDRRIPGANDKRLLEGRRRYP